MPIITWIDGLQGGNEPEYALMPEGPEWIFAHQSTVNSALRKEASKVASKARVFLSIAQARHPGTSTWIDVTGPEDGHWLDYKVHLFSKNGSRAAHAIEYGHTGVGPPPEEPDIPNPFQVKGKRYEGQFILHRAAGNNLRKQVRRT